MKGPGRSRRFVRSPLSFLRVWHPIVGHWLTLVFFGPSSTGWRYVLQLPQHGNFDPEPGAGKLLGQGQEPLPRHLGAADTQRSHARAVYTAGHEMSPYLVRYV